MPAGDVETIVQGRILQFLTSETELYGALEAEKQDANEHKALIRRAASVAPEWRDLDPLRERTKLRIIVYRIDLRDSSLDIHLLPGGLLSILRGEDESTEWPAPLDCDRSTVALVVPARFKRAGMETRLVIEGETARRSADRSLHRLLAQAYRYRAMVMRNPEKSISELAAEAGVGGSYFTRSLRLGFLAPDIVKDILHDRHPIELSANILSKDIKLPSSWEAQQMYFSGD